MQNWLLFREFFGMVGEALHWVGTIPVPLLIFALYEFSAIRYRKRRFAEIELELRRLDRESLRR